MVAKIRIERMISILEKSKRDFVFKTTVCSMFSFGVTAMFALYNGFLGVHMLSIWHGSICIFYFLLASIRGLILFTEKNIKAKCKTEKIRSRQKAFNFSVTILLFLTLAISCPIALMVKFEKPVYLTLIPAIAMAAYTTYKVTIASINIWKQKSRNDTNILITELRYINFIDALVSVLTLQNTLLMVKNTESSNNNSLILSAVSSAVIYIVIIFITLRLIATGLKQQRKQSGLLDRP